MKILCRSPEVMSCFASAQRKFHQEMPFAELTIAMSDAVASDELLSSDSPISAMILVPHESDTRLLEMSILKSMHRLWCSAYYGPLPFFVSEVLVCRRIASFYQEDMMYSFVNEMLLSGKATSDRQSAPLSKYISLNVPWLSFFGVDEYKWKYLKKLALKIFPDDELASQTKQLFSLLKKDLRIKAVRVAAAAEVRRLLLCR